MSDLNISRNLFSLVINKNILSVLFDQIIYWKIKRNRSDQSLQAPISLIECFIHRSFCKIFNMIKFNSILKFTHHFLGIFINLVITTIYLRLAWVWVRMLALRLLFNLCLLSCQSLRKTLLRNSAYWERENVWVSGEKRFF